MYIKRIFPIWGVIIWTKKYIILFTIISLIPAFLFDVLGWKWLHLPWLPIGLLGTAVAFIAGFKNNASYDRLWEGRKIWGGIVNTSRSWTIMVKDFISNEFTEVDHSKEEMRRHVDILIDRHIAWMTALRYQMRVRKPWEHSGGKKANLKYKKSNYTVPEESIPLEEAIKPYLTESERNELLKKGNKASQLLGKQSSHLKLLRDESLIDDFRHMEMQNILVELYTLQGKSERIKNFPYPRQFATLNFIFVWIFVILLPFGVMNEFESIGRLVLEEMGSHAHTNKEGFFHHIFHFIGQHFVWLSIPFSVLISWVFYCIELIGEATENPFEGNANDVPITDLTRGIERDILELIGREEIPEPYIWTNDVIL